MLRVFAPDPDVSLRLPIISYFSHIFNSKNRGIENPAEKEVPKTGGSPSGRSRLSFLLKKSGTPGRDMTTVLIISHLSRRVKPRFLSSFLNNPGIGPLRIGEGENRNSPDRRRRRRRILGGKFSSAKSPRPTFFAKNQKILHRKENILNSYTDKICTNTRRNGEFHIWGTK